MAKKTEETGVDAAEKVANAIRHWSSIGEVIKARDLRRQLAAGGPIDPKLLHVGRVKPTADVEDVMEEPARTGRGSGIKNWQEFAKAMTDMDPEVIEAMEKDELILALESNGVIATEEEDETE
jgi:hypothetical protein